MIWNLAESVEIHAGMKTESSLFKTKKSWKNDYCEFRWKDCCNYIQNYHTDIKICKEKD